MLRTEKSIVAVGDTFLKVAGFSHQKTGWDHGGPAQREIFEVRNFKQRHLCGRKVITYDKY